MPAENLNRIALAYTPVERVAYYELVLSSEGTAPHSWLLADPFAGQIDNTQCSFGTPEIQPGERWCAELRAVAANGEWVLAGEPTCTDVVDCGDGCTEAVSSCGTPAFEPGPEAVEQPSGCGVTGGTSSSAVLVTLVALLRRRRRCAIIE